MPLQIIKHLLDESTGVALSTSFGDVDNVGGAKKDWQRKEIIWPKILLVIGADMKYVDYFITTECEADAEQHSDYATIGTVRVFLNLVVEN